MSIYEYFLIVLALIFCGYASWTDLKTQKIRNVCSLGLLYVGTLSQLMAWYLGTTTPLYILGLFFGSGIIAFAFYWFGIFSPGDSKLFWGLCLIFPLSLFRNLSGSLSFPPLILALNIVIPYSAGLFGYLLFKFVLMPNKLGLLRGFVMSNFQGAALLERLFNLLFFIGIATALTYLLELLGWQPDRFLSLILVLVVFALVQRLLVMVPKTLHTLMSLSVPMRLRRQYLKTERFISVVHLKAKPWACWHFGWIQTGSWRAIIQRTWH